jgi:hypothetical protein
MLLIGTVAVSLPAGGEARAAKGKSVIALTLEGALVGGKTGRAPLTIHLDWSPGGAAHAFGTARTFNVTSHEVDASGLKLAGNRLRGEVKVTIHPDNWMPKGRKHVACVYAIDAALDGDTLAGTYKGTYGDAAVSGAAKGRLEGRPKPTEPVRFDFILERGMNAESKHWGNRVYASVVIRRGGPVAPKVHSPNNTAYADFTCHVAGVDWKLAGGRLNCTFTVNVTPAGRKLCSPGKHVIALDGRVIGSSARRSRR